MHRDCHVAVRPRAVLGAVHAGRQDAVAARHRHRGVPVPGLPAASPRHLRGQRPGERVQRARSPAAGGASLLRPRPRVVPAAGARRSARRAPSSSSGCSPTASSSGCAPRKACCGCATALRRRAAGGRLRARAVPRQPVLPHRQDHPRRRLRPAAAAVPPMAAHVHAAGRALRARAPQLLFDPDAPRH